MRVVTVSVFKVEATMVVVTSVVRPIGKVWKVTVAELLGVAVETLGDVAIVVVLTVVLLVADLLHAVVEFISLSFSCTSAQPVSLPHHNCHV